VVSGGLRPGAQVITGRLAAEGESGGSGARQGGRRGGQGGGGQGGSGALLLPFALTFRRREDEAANG
jgi:hypothetical protein